MFWNIVLIVIAVAIGLSIVSVALPFLLYICAIIFVGLVELSSKKRNNKR